MLVNFKKHDYTNLIFYLIRYPPKAKNIFIIGLTPHPTNSEPQSTQQKKGAEAPFHYRELNITNPNPS